MLQQNSIRKATITEMARQHFNSALSKGQGGLLRGLLRHHKQAELLDYQDVCSRVRRAAQRDLGLRTVPVSQIVGSMGRAHDFDNNFMPRTDLSRFRWMNIDCAYHSGVELPPVELVKLGEDYFVTDGHNRLSVAILHGQEFIEALVVEIDTDSPDMAN